MTNEKWPTHTPYTLKRVGTVWFTPGWNVLYEDDVVDTFIAPKEFAVRYVEMLNISYSLGVMNTAAERYPYDPKGPYLLEARLVVDPKWNPEYDQDAICECGDPYYRHFDTYENMAAVGCKYCDCFHFKPKE